MAQRTSPICRTLLAGFLKLTLLLGIIALPSFAFAVDTDGDGVDDSADAFPNHKEASVDTDGDGKPDTIVTANIPMFEDFEAPLVGWTYNASSIGRVTGNNITVARQHSGGYGGGGLLKTYPAFGSFQKSVTYSSGATITFWRVSTRPTLYIDGAEVAKSCTNTNQSTWGKCTAAFPAGTHTLEFRVSVDSCMLGFCSNGDIDDISVSTLIEDLDDDNDGVADTSDAFPLDAAESLDTDLDGIGNNADLDDDGDGVPDVMDPLPLQAKFNLNAPYKGSQIGDQNTVQ